MLWLKVTDQDAGDAESNFVLLTPFHIQYWNPIMYATAARCGPHLLLALLVCIYVDTFPFFLSSCVSNRLDKSFCSRSSFTSALGCFLLVCSFFCKCSFFFLEV